MGRRGQGHDDYDDDDLERRMDDIRSGRSSGPFDDLIMLAFGALLILGLIAGGLGWLDSQFGWGLLPAFKGWIEGLFT